MAPVKITMDWDAIKRDPVEFAEKLLKGPDDSPFRAFEASQSSAMAYNEPTYPPSVAPKN